MSNKWTVAWFVWGFLIVGAMIWHDTHLPNCLALYGSQPNQSIYAGVERSEQFLSCEDSNTASVFGAQALGIGVMVGVPLVGCAVFMGVYVICGACIRVFRSVSR